MKRRPPNTDASRRYHDRVARQYDAIYDDPYWEFHDRLTWSAIRPHLPVETNSACLDLGCGTGKWGLKTLKSGYPTTFVDNAAAMIEQVRAKLPDLGPKEKKATLLVADIIDLSALPGESFTLTLAMGDPLSICSDPAAATREMFRLCKPGGTVIATADNKLAALDHYFSHATLDQLEEFIHTNRTQWLTQDERGRFSLTTFTPSVLEKLFTKAGFTSIEVTGKTILPIRKHKSWLDNPETLDRLFRLEQRLSEDPSSAASAAHLQIKARRPAL